MVKFEEQLAEIRKVEEMLKHPKNPQQKYELGRRLHRLRREYRQAKMFMAQAKR